MWKVPNEFIPIVGPVVAALIAGGVAYLASVLTKESKVSEFRQAWIDGLRNDMSEFVSIFYFIATDIGDLSMKDSLSGWHQKNKDEFLKIEAMQARIELRLNPTEHGNLISMVRGLARLDAEVVAVHVRRVEKVNELLAETQFVLGTEWKRVKRGEAIYRLTKWISLGLLIITAAILIVAFAI